MNMSARYLVLLLLILTALTPTMAEIFQWTDEHGKVHYGDKGPEGQQVKSYQGRAAVSFVGGGGGGAVHASKVRLFVTQTCPYCKKAKAFLRQRGTPFEELDIETSASAEAEYQRLGGNGVPVILVGSQRMDGFDESELAGMLKSAGL